jgi:hypothetical protein
VIRAGDNIDTVAKSWWTGRTRFSIAGTPDPELYRYGVHGPDFWADFTVGPGTYYARLKFAESRNTDPRTRVFSIRTNGKEVVFALDIGATAAGTPPATAPARPPDAPYAMWSPGLYRAVDLVFNDIMPEHGVISIRVTAPPGGEAIIQAIEVGPGDGGKGATPVSLTAPAAAVPAAGENLLRNGGFEEGAVGDLGAMGKTGGGHGWTYVFAGASQAYIWAESAYSIHPDWGLPKFHGGKEALRTHADRDGRTIVYQDVEARSETAYTASVWVRAEDLHGKGFGASACDSAGIRVQEFDAKGAVVVDHPKRAVTKAGDFVKLELPFTTNRATVRIRFILDTVIAAPYTEGHVTYDDCFLAAPAPRGG